MNDLAPIPVVAALLFRNDRLLITQRPPGKHLAGLWEFPGGKLEVGEAWETGLKREMREELGTEVIVGELFEEITHHYPTKSVQLRFFVCGWERGEPQTLECAAIAWVTPAELAHYEFPPADAQLIGRLQTEPWPSPPTAGSGQTGGIADR